MLTVGAGLGAERLETSLRQRAESAIACGEERADDGGDDGRPD